MLSTVRLALGFVALWKAVDLALRLPGQVSVAMTLVVLVLWLGGAALLVLDRRTHVAGAALAVSGSASILAADLYNHHLYLFVVIGMVLALFVSAEQLTLLRWQLTIVYAFAVLAKINGTFLSGAVVRASLERSTVFRDQTLSDEVMTVLSVATILIELALPIALWWGPRGRRFALVAGFAFHVSVVIGTAHDLESFVQLVSFGAVMLALYLAFFTGDGTAVAETHQRSDPSASSQSVRT